MRRKTIQYMVESSGTVWSRVGDKVALPVVDYDGMTPENNYRLDYKLEAFSVFDAGVRLVELTGTRKIPLRLKNFHRKFWGMTPIKNMTRSRK